MTRALALSLVLALSLPAHAAEPSRRGLLTAVGLALAAGGVICLGTGGLSLGQAAAFDKTRTAYGTPRATEAQHFKFLQDEADAAYTKGLALVIGGAVGVAAGIVLVIVDGLLGKAPPVAIVPLPNGGAAVWTGTW